MKKNAFQVKNKKYSLLTLIVLAVFYLWKTFWPAPAPEMPVDPDLTVKVFYIGQGDSILIKSGKDAVLVDSGIPPEKENLVRYLKAEGVKELALLVGTHPHGDHIGGMDAVLKNFPVKRVLDGGQVHTSKMFLEYLKTVKEKKIPFTAVKPGDKFQLDGGAYLEVLWPQKPFIEGTSSDLNNNSVVLKLVKGDFSMLLTGDIQKEAEKVLLAKDKAKLKSDVLKVPHHASGTSSTTAFIKAVGAKDVVVSCGIGNNYNFPEEHVVERYRKEGAKMYVTSRDGAITIKSDGKSYNITKEK